MHTLSDRDIEVLSHLRADARKSLVAISKETQIPVSTLSDKLVAHKGSSIKKFTAILDFPSVGYNIRKNIILKSEGRDSLLSFLSLHKNVNSIFKVNSGYSFIVDCIFKEMEEWYVFKTQLDNLADDQIILDITKEIKREDFLNKSYGAAQQNGKE